MEGYNEAASIDFAVVWPAAKVETSFAARRQPLLAKQKRDIPRPKMPLLMNGLIFRHKMT